MTQQAKEKCIDIYMPPSATLCSRALRRNAAIEVLRWSGLRLYPVYGHVLKLFVWWDVCCGWGGGNAYGIPIKFGIALDIIMDGDDERVWHDDPVCCWDCCCCCWWWSRRGIWPNDVDDDEHQPLLDAN